MGSIGFALPRIKSIALSGEICDDGHLYKTAAITQLRLLSGAET
jgi:hypothetical protein